MERALRLHHTSYLLPRALQVYTLISCLCPWKAVLVLKLRFEVPNGWVTKVILLSMFLDF